MKEAHTIYIYIYIYIYIVCASFIAFLGNMEIVWQCLSPAQVTCNNIALGYNLLREGFKFSFKGHHLHQFAYIPVKRRIKKLILTSPDRKV